MGAGGDARPFTRQGLIKRIRSSERLKSLGSVKDDLIVLKSLWFKKIKGTDHAARLEAFYSPQAHAYDKFRSEFLWGRKPMLSACAARLQHLDGMVWVDLGGGTGENVDMMSKYIDLAKFKAIYVVDLCASLCDVARKKVAEKGWKNVHVVEADACTYAPPEDSTTLVTFSYSLTMIPSFHSAVDQAVSYLDKNEGLLGVADFFVSAKYDLPLRQMNWLRRVFWRSVFDMDNIDIGPERRHYLDHMLKRVCEFNSEGSIPYVPYLRAPYYVWVGRVRHFDEIYTEAKVEAPAMFPPTFLYTQSWEDPRPDMEVMKINSEDVCLTLTSGGCNALNLCMHGARKVVSVDCNPAQSALLQLKQVAIKQLDYEDVWALFGEGRHPHIEELFETELGPWLSQASYNFWRTRLHYFKQGLYYQGGMGFVCWFIQGLIRFFGLRSSANRLVFANSLEEQRAVWTSFWFVRFFYMAPHWLVATVNWIISMVFLNRWVMWYGGGVPCKQYKLIHDDGLSIPAYCGRTLDGIAHNSSLRHDNYFYYNCLTGKFARDNCPSFLTPAGFKVLKAGQVDALSIKTDTFMNELNTRKYTKIILMDHVDWLDCKVAREVAAALGRQVLPGGVVIWRSAALTPPYAAYIRDAGFEVKCLQKASDGYMDRVNMYCSFYMATKKPSTGAAA